MPRKRSNHPEMPKKDTEVRSGRMSSASLARAAGAAPARSNRTPAAAVKRPAVVLKAI